MNTLVFAWTALVENTASRIWTNALPALAAMAPLVATTSTRIRVPARWVSPAPIVRPTTKTVPAVRA